MSVPVAQALCPAKGCESPIQSGKFCCPRHWAMLPSGMKELIFQRSVDYHRAIRNGRRWLNREQEAEHVRDMD